MPPAFPDELHFFSLSQDRLGNCGCDFSRQVKKTSRVKP